MIIVVGASAQTKKAFMKAGAKALKNKDYFSAMDHFGSALEFNDKDAEVVYNYAEAARQFYALEIAEISYQRVLKSPKADNFPLTKYWLGILKKQSGDYTVASKLLKEYIAEQGTVNKLFAAKAKKEIEECQWAETVVNDPHDVKIQQLNKRVNTPYSEFAPLLSGDTLYYSSYRFDNRNDTHQPPRKLTKILASVKGSKGKTLKRKFNDEKQLTAHTTFGNKGQRIYYTLCNYVGEAEIRCALYYRDMGKRKRWGPAKKLPAKINEANFTQTQPNIAIDPVNGGEVLYFVSDRPGGKGGLDIWYTKIESKKKFGDPVNLESINTEGNDITPFYHQQSNSLYFSSDGLKGMGGYDIYQSKQDNGQWKVAEHTGYPLNSSYNDIYFWLNQDSTQAYLSSNRLGSMYLEKNNKVCCNDIYKMDIYPQEDTLLVVEKEPEPIDSLVYVPEPPIVVVPPTPDPEPIPAEKPPTTLEDFLPLALYFHNDEPDKQTRKSTTKKTYETTFIDYYALKQTYIDEFTQPLSESSRWEAESELDYFFEKKVKQGHDYLNLFSEILLTRLEAGEKVEIFVKGFTSPRAKSDYNLFLGKRRVSSVHNHFKRYRDKIFEPYLKSGKLILSEKSFGETTASTNISDALDDRRNSIYSVPAAMERRVEIVEIKRNNGF